MDLLKFPLKLWKLINDNNEISVRSGIKWASDGLKIYINADVLTAFLNSEESVFRTKKLCHFIRQLNLYGFVKLNRTSTSKTQHMDLLLEISRVDNNRASSQNHDILEYRNDFFKRDQPDEIYKIQKRDLKMPNYVRKFRRSSVPRLTKNTKLTPLEKARARLRSILNENKLKRNLSDRLKKCAEQNYWCIELLENEIFENAADSVSSFVQQKQAAGYYGEVTTPQIKIFFGEYLPTYSNDDATASVTEECNVAYVNQAQIDSRYVRFLFLFIVHYDNLHTLNLHISILNMLPKKGNLFLFYSFDWNSTNCKHIGGFKIFGRFTRYCV